TPPTAGRISVAGSAKGDLRPDWPRDAESLLESQEEVGVGGAGARPMDMERGGSIHVHTVGRVGLGGEGPYRLGDRRNPSVGPRQLDDERPGGRAFRQLGRLRDSPSHRTLPGRPSSSWEPDLPRQASTI